MIRRPPRSTLSSSSAASDVYKRQMFVRVRRWTASNVDHPLTSVGHWVARWVSARMGGESVPSVRVRQRARGPMYTALYRDPSGRQRSAGTFTSERAALRAARRAESTVETGGWIDQASGRITFRDYVQQVWLPSRQVEVSTLAGYRSYLGQHFLPFFGDRPMAEILPSIVQHWVTAAVASGLSPTSVTKYHVMLHSVFKRAVRDRVSMTNPCEGTELPKIPPRKARILTPQEYDRLFSKIPDRFSVLVRTDIETGLRWGERIALRPRHIDFLRKTISV